MNTVVTIVLIFHLLAMGYVFGGSLISLQLGKVTPGLIHGALSALGLGIVMVVMRELQADYVVDHLKIGIKLIIGLAVCFSVWYAQHHRERRSAALVTSAALVGVNVAVATLL
ncbi:MAG: hypothetical protein Q4Q03_05385 [Bowdeniella nasicola]|nr:hypothetical protein [Bowdeniella nasicola]